MLEQDLMQFIGTEHYYRHPLTSSVFTDGVKYFCDEAGAYWFLDIVVTEYDLLQKSNGFVVIDLLVSDRKADIKVTDGNDFVMKERHISSTDCPEGSYRFFFTNNVLMVASEY